MGCKVLDFLPLTNKPDLQVLETGLKKAQEESAKRKPLTPEELKEIFISKCVSAPPESYISDRSEAALVRSLSNEMISYISTQDNNFSYSRGEYDYSFLSPMNYYPSRQLRDAYQMTINRLNFESVNLENSMQHDSRYNLIMNNLPRANMKDVRELAKNLDMVIIPVEFSHPKVLFGDDKKLQDMFNMFNNNTDDDLYVMCPVNFYNHYRHLISKSEKEMFIPERFQSAFDALEMTRGTLSFILDKIDENSNEIVMLNKRVENLANRVDILENIEKERREEQKRREMEFKYRNLDPMIINIPKEENVNQWEGETKIHMLWGEDLPDILLENSKLKVFKDNKNAHPEKVYDYISKSSTFDTPQIRFKATEEMVKRFYMNKDIDVIVHNYTEYSNMTGASIPRDGYDIETNAIRLALKTIRGRVSMDINTLTSN